MDPANGGRNYIDSTPHARGNAANQAGSSFSLLPDVTTFEWQLAKMKERGLTVEDDEYLFASAMIERQADMEGGAHVDKAQEVAEAAQDARDGWIAELEARARWAATPSASSRQSLH